MTTLRDLGLFGNGLLPVSGPLAELYNHSLEKIVGKRTSLTEFHIDKRGESPEIEAELGPNCLQTGPSHRYAIIVSPDQSGSPLIDEEFTFDDTVLDMMYANFGGPIGIVTRIDGLYGELNDSVDHYPNLESLLGIRSVRFELHTPSNFQTKAREQQLMVDQLMNKPSLLVDNDSDHVKKLLANAIEIGDLRNVPITKINLQYEVQHFGTVLFQGAYIFRITETTEPLTARKPSKRGRSKNVVPLDDMSAMINFLGANKLMQNAVSDEHTTVIYMGDIEPQEGPNTLYISAEANEAVIKFLLDNRYAAFSKERLAPSLRRIEDLTLVSASVNPTEIDEQTRQRLIHKYTALLPSQWRALRDLQTNLSSGYRFGEIVGETDPSTQLMLLSSTAQSKDEHIVQQLLTKLRPADYETMLRHNRRDLELQFSKANPTKRDYIVSVLKQGEQK